jgi:kexin
MFLFILISLAFADIYSIENVQNATEFANLHNLRHLKNIAGHDIFEGTLDFKKRFTEPIFKDFKKKQIKRYFKNGITDPLFPSQWHLNVVGFTSYTGRGVNIAIVDDGLQWRHPDLQANYIAGLSYDFNGRDGDPTPSQEDGHGTSCAGVAAAARNNICGRGVAYEASLIGIRLIAAPVYDYQEAEGLSHKREKIRIYSSSWGPNDDGMDMVEPGPVLKSVLKQGFESGRNIYVWAGGNGRHHSDSSNYDGYANSPYTFAIGAVDYNGNQAYYSESGANLLAVTPSSGAPNHGIVTTDLMGPNGYSPGDCTLSFGGTSSSAPLAAGIIALILDARPDFSTRDVQHVIAKYATRVGSEKHTNEFGFGILKIQPILEGAKTWQKVKNFKRVIYGSDEPMSFIEQVLVTITMSHSKRGDIEVSVTSPKTTSILASKRGDNHSGMFTWTYKSLRHWGEEYKKGDRWVVSAHPGNVNSVKIEFIGI